MARRGREAMNKRARERARQEKQEAKQEKRESRAEELAAAPVIDEAALMDEFARLSERYGADQLSKSEYEEERRRIFEELGIEGLD